MAAWTAWCLVATSDAQMVDSKVSHWAAYLVGPKEDSMAVWTVAKMAVSKVLN